MRAFRTEARQHWLLSLYLLIAGVYLITASGRIGLSDSIAMFNVAQSLIDRGTLESGPCTPDANDPLTGSAVGCVPGVDGRRYAAFGPVPSLVAVPAIVSARVASRLLHVNPVLASKVAVSLLTAFVGPVACIVLALWATKLGYSRWTAIAAASILAFASPYWWTSVKGFLSEPYFTIAILVAACLISTPTRQFAYGLAGLAFGLACATRLNGALLFPVFILSIGISARVERRSVVDAVRAIAQFSTIYALVMAALALTNYVRFGSVFKSGYHLAFPSVGQLLSVPLADGLHDILFNGEVGLLVYVPWLVVALVCVRAFARGHLQEAVLFAASFAIYLLFFAKYAATPGWVAGPRFLVPLLPFAIIAMLPAIERWLESTPLETWRTGLVKWSAFTLVALGAVIQVIGTAFPEERYYLLYDFYEHRASKPWWSGSLPLASLDFLMRNRLTTGQSVDPVADVASDPETARNPRGEAFAAASARTEEEFLSLFQNPTHMTTPNLMWFKYRLMGLSKAAAMTYVGICIAMIVSGVIGIRRCRFSSQPEGSAIRI
jgi:hypothetical protein